MDGNVYNCLNENHNKVSWRDIENKQRNRIISMVYTQRTKRSGERLRFLKCKNICKPHNRTLLLHSVHLQEMSLDPELCQKYLSY